MKHFGSAINFYGGVGKCHCKKFVKDTVFNTQKRIRTFTLQVAQRYYEGMTLEIAKKYLDIRMDNGNFGESSDVEAIYETKINVAGKYQFTLVGLDDNDQFMDHSVSNKKIQLPLKFIHGLSVFSVSKFNLRGRHTITVRLAVSPS
jgi:hypothetical protein